MEGLGIVGKNYEILQNMEAFDFLDSLTSNAKFETAGNYGPNGARSFITMSTEPMEILGDPFKPYLLFTNSFDGTGSVRVMFTNIRVFCSNTLLRAYKEASNKISIRHSPSLKGRLDNAKTILLENTNYLEMLKKESEQLAKIPFTGDQFKNLINETITISEEDSSITKIRNEALQNQLINAYNQDDLQNFNNTAYKAVQAVADYESHKPAFRNTQSLPYKNITTVMMGIPLLNMLTNKILATAA